MKLSEEIQKRNLLFCKEHKNIIMNMTIEALENEFRDLGAQDSMKLVFSLGRAEVETLPERMISRFYSEDDAGRVLNYYQYINMAYQSILERSKALDFENQKELDSLHEELKRDKKDELEPLSLSTVMSLEALMEYDRAVIEAKSKQRIEKRSYTGVRDIARKAEQTNERLKSLGSEVGFDAEGIYKALENIRLKINAIERDREDKLKKGQRKFMEIFDDFCEALQEHLEAVSTIGFLKLPNVYSVEDIPLVEKSMLSGIFYKILSADKSILPQKSETLFDAFPMPYLVLAPVTGYVVSATSLAVERFRQNVILFPMRCLEDPVAGITRELLKLKKKIDHRRESVAVDSYKSYIRSQNVLGKSYESMYDKFLRFCVGDTDTISGMKDDERKIIGGHFIQRYTTDIFIPPEIWPVVANMKVGNDKARALFNEAIVLFRDDPFTAGTLHANRAIQYHNFIGEYKGTKNFSEKIFEKHKSSRDANLKAAKRLFKKSYQVGKNSRFALFNMAVMLIVVPDENNEQHLNDLDIAVKLLEKSMIDATADFWTYRAETFIAECCQKINAEKSGEVKNDAGAQDSHKGIATHEQDSPEEAVSFVSWIHGKIKKGIGY